MAQRLISISSHLASAADYGAATAHRLAGIAHMKAAEIDDSAPLTEEGVQTLKGISVLSRMHKPEDEKRTVVILHPDDWEEWLMTPNIEAARDAAVISR